MAADEIIGALRVRRPTWRVVRVTFPELEGELRRRDASHTLEAVTYTGGQYTLFFRLRHVEPREETHVRKEATHTNSNL
jgi:hypothetical protein